MKTGWNPFWDIYVGCGCALGALSTLLFDGRCPGNVPMALGALAGVVLTVWIPRLMTSSSRRPEILGAGLALTLFLVAVSAAPAAYIAVVAIYPVLVSAMRITFAIIGVILFTVVPLTGTICCSSDHLAGLPSFLVAIALCLVIGIVISAVEIWYIQNEIQRLLSSERQHGSRDVNCDASRRRVIGPRPGRPSD